MRREERARFNPRCSWACRVAWMEGVGEEVGMGWDKMSGMYGGRMDGVEGVWIWCKPFGEERWWGGDRSGFILPARPVGVDGDARD